ncbi:MAG TPA: IPTL-CTERM sorting domain-containing protein [Casimicrobiaceae bacterium]|nr:IPTL-CTERM sorting domain-containing protein [Casimicrobiaceae bacterium]
MKPHLSRAVVARVLAVFLAALAALAATPAMAARVGILSNKYAIETAADFNNRIPSHTFTPIDTSNTIPTLSSLTSAYDILLVFEDSTYPNATPIGNVAAAFAGEGRTVILGAFYEQDRSDAPASVSPHGWGTLEQIDPNTTDGVGTPYAPRTLNTGTMVVHPLSAGVKSLTSAKFAGGNKAKPGTIVIANWTQPNAQGGLDPAIDFRITGSACVIMLAIAPDYPSTGVAGTDFTGDFYVAWKNAFDFGAAKCTPTFGLDPGGPPANVPTLSQWGLALTVLLLAALAALALRRRARRP